VAETQSQVTASYERRWKAAATSIAAVFRPA